MAERSSIEWCDTSLSFWFGCTQLSRACDHCHAKAIAHRLKVEWNGPPRAAAESAWAKPAAYQGGAKRWFKKHGRARRVFVNHLSDFFDKLAPQAWRDRACTEMELAPDVIFILVTKRPQFVTQMVPAIWLLVTGEDQTEFDRRVAWLLTIPGPTVRGVSMEPMLETVHVGWAFNNSDIERARAVGQILKRPVAPDSLARLNWMIIGGESGKDARPMPEPAARDVMTQSQLDGAAVFFKQRSQADHPKTYKDFDTFPAALQVREFPA
jgi:protein gp37